MVMMILILAALLYYQWYIIETSQSEIEKLAKVEKKMVRSALPPPKRPRKPKPITARNDIVVSKVLTQTTLLGHTETEDRIAKWFEDQYSPFGDDITDTYTSKQVAEMIRKGIYLGDEIDTFGR